eukprot:4640566-Heterocapsa_arctica.AAC.1
MQGPLDEACTRVPVNSGQEPCQLCSDPVQVSAAHLRNVVGVSEDEAERASGRIEVTHEGGHHFHQLPHHLPSAANQGHC